MVAFFGSLRNSAAWLAGCDAAGGSVQLSGLLLWRLSCGAAKVSKGLQKGGTVIFGFAFCFGWGGAGVGVSERSERGEGVANALSL